MIHQPGHSLLVGDYTGKKAFAEYRQKVSKLTDGTLAPELHELLGGGEHAVALFRFTAERNGRAYSCNEAGIYHVRNGKLCEAWILPKDFYAFDEFWSQADNQDASGPRALIRGPSAATRP